MVSPDLKSKSKSPFPNIMVSYKSIFLTSSPFLKILTFLYEPFSEIPPATFIACNTFDPPEMVYTPGLIAPPRITTEISLSSFKVT